MFLKQTNNNNKKNRVPTCFSNLIPFIHNALDLLVTHQMFVLTLIFCFRCSFFLQYCFSRFLQAWFLLYSGLSPVWPSQKGLPDHLTQSCKPSTLAQVSLLLSLLYCSLELPLLYDILYILPISSPTFLPVRMTFAWDQDCLFYFPFSWHPKE